MKNVELFLHGLFLFTPYIVLIGLGGAIRGWIVTATMIADQPVQCRRMEGAICDVSVVS